MEDLPGLSYTADPARTPSVSVKLVPSSEPYIPPVPPRPVSMPEPPVSAPSPAPKPDSSKQPSDFYFGKCLGEGAYARVVHAKLKKNSHEFAVKIMEKRHIKKENKVGFAKGITIKILNLFEGEVCYDGENYSLQA